MEKIKQIPRDICGIEWGREVSPHGYSSLRTARFVDKDGRTVGHGIVTCKPEDALEHLMKELIKLKDEEKKDWKHPY